MIKAIAFDLGGVCFEDGTKATVERICGLVAVPKEKVDEVFKAEPKQEGWLYRLGKLTKDEFVGMSARKLGVTIQEFEKFIELWNSNYIPIKGMKELISTLRKNYKLIVFSRVPKERFEYLDNRYSLRDSFDDFVLTYETGLNKKDVRMYKLLLEKRECNPDECVLIDDKQEMLEIAKSVGIQTILFTGAEKLRRCLESIGIKV